jgi:hypothetical protein
MLRRERYAPWTIISRLSGTFIQNAFLKFHSEYYWEIVFDIAASGELDLRQIRQDVDVQERMAAAIRLDGLDL